MYLMNDADYCKRRWLQSVHVAYVYSFRHYTIYHNSEPAIKLRTLSDFNTPSGVATRRLLTGPSPPAQTQRPQMQTPPHLCCLPDSRLRAEQTAQARRARLTSSPRGPRSSPRQTRSFRTRKTMAPLHSRGLRPRPSQRNRRRTRQRRTVVSGTFERIR